MQNFIQGEASILQDEDRSPKGKKALAMAIEYDRAANEYEKDKGKFIDEATERGEAAIKTEADRDKLIAQGTARWNEARNMAVAKKTIKKLKYAHRLETDPKETVHFEGVQETIVKNGSKQLRMRPETISIGTNHFLFQPGYHEVPKIIADEYRKMQRKREEKNERKDAMLLGKQISHDNLVRKFQEINTKYSSHSELPRLLGEW